MCDDASDTFTFPDHVRNAVDALENADECTAQHYCDLGLWLRDGESVAALGERWTWRSALLHSLELDSTGPYSAFSSWFTFAQRLEGDETVTFQGAELSRQQCLLACLACFDTDYAIWQMLATTVQDGGTFEYGVEEYDFKRAVVRALECEPRLAEEWVRLAGCLGADETVEVSGEQLSQRECLERAVRADGMNPAALRGLAALLADGESVEVGDESEACTKEELLQRAAALDGE